MRRATDRHTLLQGEQTVVDVTVLSLVYLPTFYIFKASVFSTSWDPTSWFHTGSIAYTTNIRKDVYAAHSAVHHICDSRVGYTAHGMPRALGTHNCLHAMRTQPWHTDATSIQLNSLPA